MRSPKRQAAAGPNVDLLHGTRTMLAKTIPMGGVSKKCYGRKILFKTKIIRGARILVQTMECFWLYLAWSMPNLHQKLKNLTTYPVILPPALAWSARDTCVFMSMDAVGSRRHPPCLPCKLRGKLGNNTKTTKKARKTKRKKRTHATNGLAVIWADTGEAYTCPRRPLLSIRRFPVDVSPY